MSLSQLESIALTASCDARLTQSLGQARRARVRNASGVALWTQSIPKGAIEKGRWGFVLAGVVFFTACERFHGRYATWNQAEQDGMIERGWLPGWLPRSARDIETLHDLDTNDASFRFVIDQPWRPPEDAQCRPVGDLNAPRWALWPVDAHGLPRGAGADRVVLSCGKWRLVIDGVRVFGWVRHG